MHTILSNQCQPLSKITGAEKMKKNIPNIKKVGTKMYFLFFSLIFTAEIISQVDYYSSTINQNYTCNNPLILNDTTVIHMDEDIIFDGCLPFVAGPSFNSSHSLIFYSTHERQCIVTSYSTIDLRNICVNGQQIILKGNMQWIFKQGSQLIFNENNFVITEHAKLIFENDDI